MKKVLTFALVFLIALCPLVVISYNADGDYLVEDGVLLSFSGDGTTVNIPEDVYYIADYAFKDNAKITKIVIHDDVRIIGNEAFYGCTSLKTVSGGKGVSSVGAYAFHGTPFMENSKTEIISLGSVIIGGKISGELNTPENISMIAPYAFAENTDLTAVNCSEDLTIIGEGAFYRCSELAEVRVGDEVSFVGPLAFYGTAFAGDFESDFVTIGDGFLVEYKGSGESVLVPSDIKAVSGGAFYFNSHITDVTIPEGVVSLGERAFMNCSKLKTVKLPQSLTMIGKEAFAKCKALSTITIPSDVTLMGESVFYGCSSLKTAVFKNSSDLPKGAFAKCSALEIVKLPSDITAVGDSAFLDCHTLTDIALPDTVLSIGEDAFSGADNLVVSCPKASFAYSYCSENDVSVMQMGDANKDGKLNIRDATYIQKYVASVLDMSDSEAIRGDINFDGKINVRDATYIQKLLAGMI